MRSYHYTAYRLRAQDIAEQDRALDGLDAYARAARQLVDLIDDAQVCHECGIGHVGACDSHAVQVALILAGAAR